MYLYASNKDGWTAFMFACSSGHKDVLQVHLDSWNDCIYDCFSPKDVVRILLDNSDKGIDSNAINHRGWTAFMIACQD